MKILFTGGGTMGSVSPLIAIHQQLDTRHKRQDTRDKYLWIGTKTGPEKEIVEKEGIEFKSILSGKLRRYFDVRNILDILKIKLGFWQFFFIIKKFKPDIILSAGSFVSVPVIWAGWILKVPSIIHQQDVKPSLANKLMAPFASRVTVALDKSLNDYPKDKTILVGNPIRKELRIKNYELRESKFGFKNSLPLLLVVGGATGAMKINELIWKSLDELTKFCNVIHITGKDKNSNQLSGIRHQVNNRYESYEFLTNKMFDALQLADIVISRAGMSFLTELAYLKKPSIIIPIPNSHQEDNAKYFADKDACIYLKQKELNSEKLVKEIKSLLENENRKKELGENMNKIFVDYSGKLFLNVISNLRFNGERVFL